MSCEFSFRLLQSKAVALPPTEHINMKCHRLCCAEIITCLIGQEPVSSLSVARGLFDNPDFREIKIKLD